MIYEENIAALFAFIQGLFMDIYSGSIYGLHAFLYLCICTIIYVLSNFLDIHSKIGHIMTLSLVMLLKGFLFVLITYAFFQDFLFNTSFYKSQVLCIILTVLVSPFIFKLLNKLRYDKNI